MISARDAVKRIRLSNVEQSEVQRLGGQIVAVVRDGQRDASGKVTPYDGTPFQVSVPVGANDTAANQATVWRVVCALQRRFAVDGWLVGVEMDQDAYGELRAYKMTFAVDGAALRQAAPDFIDAQAPSLALVLAVPNKPVLSAILGTFNRLACLKAAVASVRKAVVDPTGKVELPYEIVVTDGGSTDGSREWLVAQPDVVLIGERRLEGAVKAFNAAFAASRGQFVANLNDDMVVEGSALHDAVEYLEAHPTCGQIAFGFGPAGGDSVVNDVSPGILYANFGVIRRDVADTVAYIQGGDRPCFWNPCYHTYAADCEMSAWVWRLGYTVDALSHLHVVDVQHQDKLREGNQARYAADTKRMYARWRPVETFKLGGPPPRVSDDEVERLCEVVAGAWKPVAAAEAKDVVTEMAALVGFPEPQEERRLRALAPKIRALDPVEECFQQRVERLPADERVLHVSLCTDADPQAGLVRALKAYGSAGYSEVRWFADYGTDSEERQRAILREAKGKSLIFMQLQALGAVSVETVREVRRVAAPEAVIATWCGDIADVNSPWRVDEHVALGRVVDLVCHSSMSHVRALRAAGVHNACWLDIAIDDAQYRPWSKSGFPTADVPTHPAYDVCFLGSRYGDGDTFSKSMRKHDAALRDEAVLALKRAFGDRCGLFGRGWAAYLATQGVEHVDRVVPLAQAHEVYWRSKTALSVSLANDLECYSSDRLHRILGCGTLALVKAFPGMDVLGIDHGKNCMVWDDVDELVDVAKMMVEEHKDRARASYADAGARLAAERHTWGARMRELAVYVDAVRSSR